MLISRHTVNQAEPQSHVANAKVASRELQEVSDQKLPTSSSVKSRRVDLRGDFENASIDIFADAGQQDSLCVFGLADCESQCIHVYRFCVNLPVNQEIKSMQLARTAAGKRMPCSARRDCIHLGHHLVRRPAEVWRTPMRLNHAPCVWRPLTLQTWPVNSAPADTACACGAGTASKKMQPSKACLRAVPIAGQCTRRKE